MGLFTFAALFGPLVAPSDPYVVSLEHSLEPPTLSHPLGRDALGRDLLARLLYGARLAFLVSVMGVGAGALGGTALGLSGGYFGGHFERSLMRVVDLFLAFPGFLLALGAASVLGPGTGNLIIAVGFFSFPPFVRIARALAISLKHEEFVRAARGLGAGHRHILTHHILKNAAGPLTALAALRMAAALATASGLSFLGLGPPLPAADWGSMLDAGREYLWRDPRLVLVPGCALVLTSIGFYLLGDGTSDSMAHEIDGRD